MCLIAFHFAPGSNTPLTLVANRDEFHARPAAPLAGWEDAPWLVGGRDLEAGGTWLAVHRRGRFAAVTNVRDPRLAPPSGAPSRGALVREALETDDLDGWLERQRQGDALGYAGFNLLVGDARAIWHLERQYGGSRLSAVGAGLHGLSNASLDTPWPKLCRVTDALAADLKARAPDMPRTRARFHDAQQAADRHLPDTGLPLDQERRLSAAFIIGEEYGTRATTHLTLRADAGDAHFCLLEQRFDPWGRPTGETRLRVPIAGATAQTQDTSENGDRPDVTRC